LRRAATLLLPSPFPAAAIVEVPSFPSQPHFATSTAAARSPTAASALVLLAGVDGEKRRSLDRSFVRSLSAANPSAGTMAGQKRARAYSITGHNGPEL